jgi:hypothetical protein
MAGDAKQANCPLAQIARFAQADYEVMNFACKNHGVVRLKKPITQIILG